MIDSYPPPPTPAPGTERKVWGRRGTEEQQRCDYCGRFMRHVWFRVGDDPDGWDDYWSCFKDPQHKLDHPEDWS